MGPQVGAPNKLLFIAILMGIAINTFSFCYAIDKLETDLSVLSLSKRPHIKPDELANDDQFWQIDSQFKLGKYKEARSAYKNAIAAGQYNQKVKGHYIAEFANCQLMLYNFSAAYQNYMAVLQLDDISDNLRARCWHNCGLIQEMFSNHDLAIQCYKQSIYFSGKSRILLEENVIHINLCLNKGNIKSKNT